MGPSYPISALKFLANHGAHLTFSLQQGSTCCFARDRSPLAASSHQHLHLSPTSFVWDSMFLRDWVKKAGSVVHWFLLLSRTSQAALKLNSLLWPVMQWHRSLAHSNCLCKGKPLVVVGRGQQKTPKSLLRSDAALCCCSDFQSCV